MTVLDTKIAIQFLNIGQLNNFRIWQCIQSVCPGSHLITTNIIISSILIIFQIHHLTHLVCFNINNDNTYIKIY